MGDFNDEPFSRSITEYTLATNSKMKVQKSKSPRLLNLMWRFPGKGIGTYYFSNFSHLFDQFMVSKGILNGKGCFKVKDDSAKIVMSKEMVSGGSYPKPIKFGRPSKGLNKNGFSDHYPISMVLEEIL